MKTGDRSWGSLYMVAGAAALAALAANVLDIVLGFGDTEIVVNGAKTATDWFAVYEESWFDGLYRLGILNIVYQLCLVPIFLALFVAHRHTDGTYAALAMVIGFIGTAIYLSNNAAIPMLTLSAKHAAAASDAQRAILAAAGEAVLATGEDFTPGSFAGMFLGGIAAIIMSWVMLRSGVFGKFSAWAGIIGFSFLSLFTIWATFVPVLYGVAFYFFALIGGLLALTWFVLVALAFFRLGRAGT
ncbi:MAG TPA: DUF4386 family protein [Caldilineaceae bacterium]|nr:DUF4386 family protein [Caldilineaceae bacterium]